MKVFGKFEAVAQVCQTPVAAIWSARLSGTRGAAESCLKIIQPDSPVFDGHGKAAAEELLIAAALQQSIANKSERWAPVYELGYDGSNAFYVGKLFDRSLQRAIDLRVKVSAADLLTVVSAIVDGLVDLRTAFNRAHGNLKPANVLIGTTGRIQRENIFLSDPSAGDQDAASMARSPDVKALGEIIFALVTGRPHTAARWPVPESPEWDRLGAVGGQWWSLCNDLLNTMTRGGPMSLEKIQARLTMIGMARKRPVGAWIATAAVLALAAGGFAFRTQGMKLVDQGKQWASSLSHPPVNHESTAITLPTTEPIKATQLPDPVIAPPPVNPKPASPVIMPPPQAPVAVVPKPVPQPAPVVVPTPPPVVPEQEHPVVTPPAVSANAQIQLPSFLPPKAAAKFLEMLSILGGPANAGRRTEFVSAVTALEPVYAPVPIHTDRPWQKELAKAADARREAELTTAVAALGNGSQPDTKPYADFSSLASALSTDGAAAEDAINTGAVWTPEANHVTIEKAISEAASLTPKPQAPGALNTGSLAPSVLEEMRAIDDAVVAQKPRALLAILHEQNSSLSARLAAWQALDQPALAGHWPVDNDDFISTQKDGDALVAASAGSSVNPITAIRAYQDRRLAAFYDRLTTQAAVTDAITHLAEIEDGHTNQRPGWFEFDRIVYSMVNNPAAPTDTDMEQLKAINTVPAAVELYSALMKAKNAAAAEQPLATTGPGLLHWSARPFNVGGVVGCMYSADNCPTLEFIRVEPPLGKGLPFYLSTTDVSVGLVAAILADASQSPASATDALRALCPPSTAANPGARSWRFAIGKGIELDPDDYTQYFRQAPSLDLPMQQVTPQAALYIARDLGCRLPTTAEWMSAFDMASNPADPDAPIKGFATGGWKLRDADFASLVDKAATNQKYPDDGIFLGPDPANIPTAGNAEIWSPATIHKMGGWTVADLRTDRQAQRLMAKMDEQSSDFRGDLIDAPQVGFRPVGSTHHVFHDLVGNVAQFVLDSAASDQENLPAGTKVSERPISSFFSAPDRIKQVGVIGGSFLSPPALDPMARTALPAGVTSPAYADVGFRLAFTDPRAYADVASVIKQTGYLYPTAAKAVEAASKTTTATP
jgi:formylglycine-generating enzyme required for sulfatase activity